MSTYRNPVVNYIKPQMVDDQFWGDIQLDPDSSAPIYIGYHVTKGESDDSLTWKIVKLTYSGVNITRVQTAYGSWTLRANYF